MSEPSRSVARTAAALATRRRNTQAALGRVRDTIARLRREKAPITVAVVAPRWRFADLSLHQSGRENRSRGSHPADRQPTAPTCCRD